jgi:hypothetical protein
LRLLVVRRQQAFAKVFCGCKTYQNIGEHAGHKIVPYFYFHGKQKYGAVTEAGLALSAVDKLMYVVIPDLTEAGACFRKHPSHFYLTPI